MQNKLTVFTSEEFGSLRTLEIDGEIWFVGKDAASILGYARTADAIAAHVEGEDKGVGKIPTPGGVQEMTVINESGLYSLILSSRLSNAKKFKRWVTSEILPSIRKHGLYATPETIEKLLSEPQNVIKILQALVDERKKTAALEEENAVLTLQNAELQPKASYYDAVLNNKGVLSITEIAKDYGFSAKRLNKLLHEFNIQYKLPKQKTWILYQKHAQNGWTHTKTHTYLDKDGGVKVCVSTYWTQKGRLAIYELLKSKGILPLIEQTQSGVA